MKTRGKGLDFYDRLVDELKAAGVEPFATLITGTCRRRVGTRAGGIHWFADHAGYAARIRAAARRNAVVQIHLTCHQISSEFAHPLLTRDVRAGRSRP